MVRVKWWGHACFELYYPGGPRIVIDPHDGGSLGLPRPKTTADYVLVTHRHFDHDAVEVVKSDSTRVFEEVQGEFSAGPVRIRGVRLPHDKFGGKRRGWVTAYRIEGPDGIILGHLGDVGDRHEALGVFRNVDVLFIPVGGTYTIDAYEAWEIINELEPRIAVPMHYWVPGMNLPIDPVDEFLKLVKKWSINRLGEPEFTIESRDELPAGKNIYILPPPR